MKSQGKLDKLTERLNTIILEAECFEEQRILHAIFEGIRRPGTRIVVVREDIGPVMFVVGKPHSK